MKPKSDWAKEEKRAKLGQKCSEWVLGGSGGTCFTSRGVLKPSATQQRMGAKPKAQKKQRDFKRLEVNLAGMAVQGENTGSAGG
jgi:hypothetical protein